MQYFAKSYNTHIHDTEMDPKLLYVSHVSSKEFLESPRLMHNHHNKFELLLCMSGSCLVLIDGRPYFASTGDILIYNSNSYHQECADQSTDFSLYCVAASGLRLRGLENDCITKESAPKLLHTDEMFPVFKTLFSQIYRLVQINDNFAITASNHYLYALICELLSLYKKPGSANNIDDGSGSAIIDQIYDYLSENYDQKITLDTMSKALAISPDYISHIFKKKSGYSPMQYVTALRIGSAQMRLIETNDKISDIATDSGFNNIGNFNRTFYNLVGCSPSVFRKHNRD